MELRYLWTLARKWFWLILLGSLLGGFGGLLVHSFQPRVYEATSTLFVVTPNRSDYSGVLGDQQAAKAFVAFPKSAQVLASTLQTLGVKDLNPMQLAAKVAVENTRETQLVTVRVSDGDPAMAAKYANEIAKQSIDLYQAATTENPDSRKFATQESQLITEQIQILEKELAALRAQPDSSSESTLITGRIYQINQFLAWLRQSFQQMVNASTDLNGSQVRVLEQSMIPSSPVGSGPGLVIILGILAGMLAAVGLIIFIEETDDILRTPARIDKATGLATFISIGRQATSSQFMIVKPDPQMITAKPKSLTDRNVPEAFMSLGVVIRRENNQFTHNGKQLNSLLITSPEDGDGKTLTASQIALGMARTGTKVVLVDANLAEPSIHKIFGLSNETGLSNFFYFASVKALDANLQTTHEPNLSILAGGPAIPAPGELLSSPLMASIIAELCKTAFVIIDSPAVLTSSHPVILANKSDAIMLVVDARRTTTTKLSRSLEVLSWVNTSVLGVVLNRATRTI